MSNAGDRGTAMGVWRVRDPPGPTRRRISGDDGHRFRRLAGTDWAMNTQNVGEALARLDRMGGRALVGDVVAAFRRHGPARARETREACAGGDADRLARSAHSLRSSVGQLGADDVAALCARLEMLGGAGAIAEAFPLTSQLMADVDELLRDLESRAGEDAGEEPRRRVIGVVEDNEDTRLILR